MAKILFVDDDEQILKITELLLSPLEYGLFLANSGKMAIEILSNKIKREQIKIIFLDLTMPEMNGLDILEWISKHGITIPTILQTGISDQKSLEKAKQLGVKDFITKPYTKKQLYDFINTYVT